MGFLEMVFGRKEAPERTDGSESAITLADARRLLDRNRDEIMRSLVKSAGPKLSEMRNAVRGMESGLKALEKSKVDEEIDNDVVNQRILAGAAAGRKNFLEKAGRIVQEFGKPVGSDPDSVIGFQKSFAAVLKSVNDTALADYRLFSGVFQKESSSAFDSLKRVDRLSAEFVRMVGAETRKADSIDACRDELDRLRENVALLASKKGQVSSMEQKIKGLKERSLKLREGISSLENGEESKKLRQMTENESETQSGISEKRSLLSQTVSQLGRPVKRYKKLVDEGKADFKDKKYVNLFLEDPVEAILSHGTEVFILMLGGLEKSLSENKIGLKDGSEKAMAAIKTLTETDAVKRLVDDINRLSKERGELGGRISGSKVRDDIKKLKSELGYVERETAEHERDVANEKSSIEKLRESIMARKGSLEGQLSSITGKNVRIADIAV